MHRTRCSRDNYKRRVLVLVLHFIVNCVIDIHFTNENTLTPLAHGPGVVPEQNVPVQSQYSRRRARGTTASM